MSASNSRPMTYTMAEYTRFIANHLASDYAATSDFQAAEKVTLLYYTYHAVVNPWNRGNVAAILQRQIRIDDELGLGVKGESGDYTLTPYPEGGTRLLVDGAEAGKTFIVGLGLPVTSVFVHYQGIPPWIHTPWSSVEATPMIKAIITYFRLNESCQLSLYSRTLRQVIDLTATQAVAHGSYDLFINNPVVHLPLKTQHNDAVALSSDIVLQVYGDDGGVHVNISAVISLSVQQEHTSLASLLLTLDGQQYPVNHVDPHAEERTRVISEESKRVVELDFDAAVTPSAALKLSLAKTYSEQKTLHEWRTTETTPISHEGLHSIHWVMERDQANFTHNKTRRLLKQFTFTLELGANPLATRNDIRECSFSLRMDGTLRRRAQYLGHEVTAFEALEISRRFSIVKHQDEDRFALLA